MGNRKRIVAVLLAFLMIFEMLPVAAVAEGWATFASNVLQGASYHSVTFKVGEDTIASQYVVSGGSPVMPEAPTKDADYSAYAAYEFAGWYDESGAQITASSAITADTVATAKFNVIRLYKVTVNYVIDTDNDNVNEVAAETVVRWYTAKDAVDVIESPTNVLEGTYNDTYIPDQASITIDPAKLAESETYDIQYTVKYHVTNTTYTIYHQVRNPLYDDDPLGSEYTLLGTTVGSGLIGQTVSARGLTEAEFAAAFPGASYHYNYQSSTSVVLTGNPDTDYVTVTYEPHMHVLSYDSQGGSYVTPVTKYCHEMATVYTATTERGLTCTLTVHSHTNACFSGNNRPQLVCDIIQHTHNNTCYGDITVYSNAPTRAGYVFGGWYLEASCDNPAPESFLLAENTTVYAKWTAATVNYTVAYMKQLYDNESNSFYYVYDSSKTASAIVGTEVTATHDKSYDYYQAGNAETETVAADGSTVVMAYYDLIKYTMVFDTEGRYNYIQMTEDGTKYYGDDYQLTGIVLGMNIADLWPTPDKTFYSDGTMTLNTWDSIYKTKRFEVTTDLLDKANNNHVITFNAQWFTTTNIKVVQYWLQDTTGTKYEVSDVYSQVFIQAANDNLDPKEIYGFTKADTPRGYDGHQDSATVTVGGQEYKDVKLYNYYYNRSKYTITFMYKDSTLGTTDPIFFGADISGEDDKLTDEVNEILATLPEGTSFVGWCEDSELLGDPYAFSTMPASNLVLYAKFNPPDRTITLKHANNEPILDADGKPIVITVKHGEVPTITDPVMEGYTFMGWYSAPDGGEPYDTSKPLEHDITIYAHWQLKTIKLTIQYWTFGSTEDNFTTVMDNRVFANDALKPGEEYVLHAQHVDGYRPTEANQTIVLKVGDNYATFYYVKREAVKYTVQYVLDSDKTTVIDSFTETATIAEERVSAIAPATLTYNGQTYYPTVSVQSLVLSSDETKNVITFYYVPYKTAAVEVRYWYPAVDGTGYVQNDAIKASDTVVGVRIGDSVYADKYKSEGEVSPYIFDAEKTTTVSVTIEEKDTVADAEPVYLDLYYKVGATTLTISKTVVDETADADASKDLVFVFEVRGDNDDVTLVPVKAGESVTVDGLIIGKSYTVTEVGVDKQGDNALDAWKTEAAKPIILSADASLNTLSFTNTRKIAGGEGGVKATKTWDGTPASKVELQLYRNGEAYQTPVTVTAEGSWSYTWNNLPEYDLNGKLYTYTVKEVGATDGKIVLDGYLYEVTESGLNVTNTQVTGEITVSLADKTVVYTGSEQSLDAATITDGPEGLTLEALGAAVSGGKGTDIGAYPATFVDVDGDEAPKTYLDASTGILYDVTYVPATLYITGMIVEHYLENLGADTYTLVDKTIEGVEAGTYQDDDYQNTYTGFTYAHGAVDNVTSVTVTAGEEEPTMRLYYTRNTYKVTYKYIGFVPEDATALPADATYEYGAPVTVAPAATAVGYEFSGWDRDNFTMPAQDVVITGSFSAATNTPYKVEYYLQDVNEQGQPVADSYTLYEAATENRTGTTGAEAIYTQKTFENYAHVKTESTNTVEGKYIIAADGSLVIRLYYNRDVVKLTLGKDVVDPTDDAPAQGATFEINYTYAYDGKELTGTVNLPDGGKAEITLPKGGTLTVTEDVNIEVWNVTGVGEYTITGDTAVTVTNTRTLFDSDKEDEDNKLGEVTVQKAWKDGNADLADQFIPAEGVIIQLLRGVEGETAEVVGSFSYSKTSWSHTFKNLPATDLEGNPYIYSVKEAGSEDGKVPHNGYRFTVTGEGVVNDDTMVITNTLDRVEKITVTKKWVLNGIQLIHKPDLKLTLSANGTDYGTVTEAVSEVTATSDDDYIFENVPYRTDYKVVEELNGHGLALIEGVETNIHGTFETTQTVDVKDDFTAEIVNTAKYAAITVQKTADRNGVNVTIPEFTFTVAADGETKTVTLQPTEDSLTVSKQVLIPVPTGDVTVTETVVTGWEADKTEVTIPKDTLVGKNDRVVAAFKNTRKKLPLEDGTTVTVKKIISGYDETKMASELFNFVVDVPEDLKNGTDVTYQIGDQESVTVKANGSFIITGVKHGETVKILSGLPTGTYEVREEQDEENHFLYEASVAKNGDYDFTATNEPVVGSLIVEKRWEHPNGEVDSAFAYGANGQAAVTFGLFTDADATVPYTDANGDAVTVTTNANGDAIFTHINPGTYYLKEIKLENAVNYELSDKILEVVVKPSEEIPAAYTFTNALKRTTEDAGAILIEKLVENVKIENVTFTITYSYVLTDESDARSIVGGEIKATVGADGTITYTGDTRELVDLPYGTIVTVKEIFDGHAGEAWTTKIGGETVRTATVTAGAENQTVTVENIRKLRGGDGVLNVNKVWIDGESEDRPVLGEYVKLYNKVHDGDWAISDYGDQAINDDQTIISYENLPAYDLDGNLLTYAVKEDAMPAYRASTTDYVLNGGTIVNTLLADVTVTKVWKNVEGEDIMGAGPVDVEIFHGDEIAAEVVIPLDTLEATVSVPKYDADGVAYVYTIKEAGEEDGLLKIGEVDYDVTYTKNGDYSFTVTNTKEDVEKTSSSEASMTVQVIKDGETIDMVKVGGKITYSIRYGNYSAQTATVTVTDTLAEGLTFVAEESTPGAVVEGQKITWTMENVPSHVRGTITLVAMVNEAAISGANPVVRNNAFVTVGNVTEKTTVAEETIYNPDWTVDKAIVDEKEAYFAGDVIHYTITVTNTGNVDLETLKIVDTFTVDDETEALTLTHATLNPDSFALAVGETAVFTATYTIEQDDSEIVNAVVVEDGDEDTDDPTDEVITDVEPNPAWTVEKTAKNTNGETEYRVGDVVKYTITVTNTGNVDLDKLTVSDTFTVDGVEAVLELTNAEGVEPEAFELAKGATVVFTATYTIEKDDAQLVNYVVVNDDDDDPDDPSDEVITDVEDNPDWTVTKTVVNTGSGEDGAFRTGDTIKYEITVENTGNVDLTDLTVEDIFTVDGEIRKLTLEPSAESFSVPKHGSVTFTSSYTIQATDNVLVNTAKVGDKEDEIITEIEDCPDYAIDKTVANTGSGKDGAFKAGDTVIYKIVVKNTGNTDLEGLSVKDEFFIDGVAADVALKPDASIIDLKEGESAEFTAEYTIKVTDKQLVNSVIVTGDEGDREDEVIVDMELNEAVTVKKEVINNGSGEGYRFMAGDKIRYRVTVTNVGNVDLKDLTLVETFKVNGWTKELELPEEAAKFDLAKGETVVFNYSYRILEGDARLVNVATVLNTSDKVTTDVTDDPAASAEIPPAVGYTYNVGDCFD